MGFCKEHMIFGIDRYVGSWVSKDGLCLKIEKIDECRGSVSVLSESGEPVRRPHWDDKPTSNMPAWYDDYEGDLEVDLWEKGKGFSLILTYEYGYELDQFKRDALVPALSRYEDDHFLDAYYALFGSLSHYTREGSRPSPLEQTSVNSGR